LAEQSEKDGLEFPVFKSETGAFDRAKYNQQSSEMVSDGSLTGKTMDKELMDQKRSIDKVITSAVKFYRNSFNNNIKEIDPAIDRNSVYYKEAYSGANADIAEIKIKLEDGEAIDGKEISEMSKSAAENKIGNAQKLKTGSVTQIVENLGLKNIKEFDLYEDVKSDFDSKVKDENSKFDPLLKKFSAILGYFNGDGGPMSTQKAAILYTPENNSIMAALAKILEEQGFDSESVLAMAKKYDDNLKKLNEKNKDKKAEDTIKKDEDQPKKEEGAVQTEEQKLEEKKSDEPIPIDSASESTTTPTENNTTETPALSPEQSTIETKLEEGANTTQQPQVNNTSAELTQLKEPVEENRIEGSEPVGVSTTKETSKQENRSSVDKAQDDLLSMLGIKLPGGGKNEAIQGDSKNTEDVSALGSVQDKMLEDLGFIKPKVAENTASAVSDIIGSTPKKETATTKMLEKKEDIVKSMNETFPVNSAIKETEVQNLSSVSTPDINTSKENTTTDINNTSAKVAEASSVDNINTTTENNSINNGTLQPKEEKTIDNNKDIETEKMNKEMANNMKLMVNLLSQLNNTLQNPLIVIPNDKKFI
jgi:hypothetical protein